MSADLRILHNVANEINLSAPSVDIYLGDRAIFLNLNYKDLTDYIEVPCGTRELSVKLAGTKTLIYQTDLNVQRNNIYTIVVAGVLSNPSTIKDLVYQDDDECPDQGYCNVRFIHAAAGVPAVDIYLYDTKIFSDVSYGNTGTPIYLPIKLNQVFVPGGTVGRLSISAKLAGTATTVIGPLVLYGKSGAVYSIFASGNTSTQLTSILSNDNSHRCEFLQKDFNVGKYMGKWYAIAGIPQYYDNMCERSTAEYTLLHNGNVIVNNTCYDKDWGVISTIRGNAIIPNCCYPAALYVRFPDVIEDGGIPNYLVHDTDYHNYSIVGSPARNMLYILARTPVIYADEYYYLLDKSAQLGYDIKSVKLYYHTVRKGHVVDKHYSGNYDHVHSEETRSCEDCISSKSDDVEYSISSFTEETKKHKKDKKDKKDKEHKKDKKDKKDKKNKKK